MMKIKIYTLILATFSISVFSQVGINTPNPTATLDVNGNAKIRTAPQAPSLSGYQLLAINQTTNEVSKMDPSVITTPGNTNTTVYAAKKASGISLLSLGLFPSGFRAVNFVTTESTLGNTALFSNTDNTYTVPATGIYAVGYTFRYGTGLQASLLANSPGIGILKTTGTTATLLDTRTFSGINLLILSLTISESNINSVYPLQAGDKISFGLTGSSLLDLGLLGSSASSFYIYKISN
ncbi:hypothetical protein M2347_002953 [Chryseobacterium sp. H1D6B]|uniref:hypothetical protein n=1 Tax=Chryseobacterium sp. H1D6B TaxID=2940588 RepID=UPI0017D8155B|nr:hypothetical protein [Chryseobacterium sp. H1D6B]MDH6253226.1 hypothetical protein [Chryseobacterium sp. H1D6B]